MLENWKTYKLKDVASVQTGPFGSQLHKKDYVEIGTPIITVEHLGENRITYQNLPRVNNDDKKRLIKYQINEGDVVFSRVGSVDRRAYVTDMENGWLFSGRCLRIRPFKKIACGSFLSYYFGQESFKDYIRRIAVGATMPSINTSILSNIEIKIPPFQEQKSIASILSALDDKIELNLQMNETLEEMAMALYKHWFVDFGPFQGGELVESELGMIPKGWEVKKIGDLYKTTSGGTPSRSKIEFYNNGIIPWVKSKELYGTFVIDTEEKITILGLNKSSAKLIPPKSVLLAMYGATVGESSILSIEATCNQAICAIIEKNLSYLYIFLYLRIFKSEILNQAVGSAQQNISQDIIKNIKIISPPSDLKIFTQIEFLYNSVEQNLKENQTLTTLRDTLLPKLISGKVRVKDAEKTLAAAL